MKWGFLEFGDTHTNERQGIQQVTLDIKKLFGNGNETREFRKRLRSFRDSDYCTSEIYSEEKDELLIYKTETIIPTEKKGGRTPLLLLLGNPASHSVKEKMFFSYERDRKEHRFWKVLDNSSIFPFKPQVENLKKRNEERKEKLFRVDYDSPFCVGLATFYSMPSPATGRWAGVAGIRRLLGKNAFDRVTKWEKERIEDLIKEFVFPNGLVIAFQEDAFSQIRASKKPRYSLRSAIAGDLKDKCQCSPEIDIYCFPPTRLMYSSSRHLETLVSKYTKED